MVKVKPNPPKSTVALRLKEKKLAQIAKVISTCAICQHNKSGKAVAGEGNANADIVFLGEAPGKEEAKTGRPFVGRAGKLLRGLLSDIGINPEDVYITSPVKYLPDYVTPTLEDITHGKTHLEAQLKVIEPKVIVLMGNVAAIAVLGEKIPIAQKHGEIINQNGRHYFLSYHPAAPLYSPKLREVIKKDFVKLKKFLLAFSV